MHVNLLPISLRTNQMLRRGLRGWCIVWGLVVVTLALVSFPAWRNVAALKNRLAILDEACLPLRELQNETQRLAAKHDLLVRRGASLQGMQSDGRFLRLLSLLSAHKQVAADAFQVQSLVVTTLPRPTASPAQGKPAAKVTAPAPARERWLVTLKGVAASDAAVNDVVDALRISNRFERVELKSIINNTSVSDLPREWSLECHY